MGHCSELAPILNYFDLFEKGMPPVQGGVLDQSAWFVSACSQFKADEVYAKK